MHLIWMIIIGVIAGAIAKLVMPGRDPGGFFVTMLLGIAGSFVGGFLGRLFGIGHGRLTAGLIGSIIGALILLGIYRAAVKGRHTTGTPGSTGSTGY
jgi:uncharacterized membrane protein YeaQ/YmgE (transglycosylase-associated protein family)